MKARQPGMARAAGLLVLAFSACLPACDGIFVSSDVDGVATIALSFSVASARAGDAQAFDRVDAARIVLQRRSDGTVVYDRVVTLASTGGDREASIEVDVTQDPESFDLAAQLSSAGQPLFDGAATVTVRQGQVTASDVPLQAVVAAIELSTSSITLRAIGESVPLEVAALYATGDTAYSVSPQMSSQNPAVASVSGGMITARGEGNTQILVRAGLVTATVDVRVQVDVASIEVTPAAVTIDVGEQIQLVAVVRDANGNALNRTPQWSTSSGSVASVTSSGLVRGVSAGQATIRATVGPVSGSATVTVAFDPITSVTIFPTAARLVVGQTVQFSVTLRTASGQSVNRPVQWTTSDASVASVTTSGLGTARAAGTALITATAEGVSAGAQVTVDPPVQSTVDLVAGVPVVNPSNPNTSQSVSIQATIRNGGNAASGTFAWRLRVGATVVATGTTSLAANASTTVSATGLGPYTQGIYTATLDVDYAGAVSETDEKNNTAATTFAVGQAPFVDLVAGTPVVTPSSPTSAQTFSVQATVTNAGNANSATFAWRLRIGATIVASGNTSLLAGAGTQVGASGLGPYNVSAYTATLEVDYLNAVNEPDENNNTASTTFTVTQAPFVELVAGTPVVTPSSPSTTDPVSIQAVITNTGTLASGTFAWRLRVNGSTVSSGNANIASGGNTTVSATGLGPYNVGTYTATLEVDYQFVVTEPNENNNIASTTFNVAQAPEPDLVAGTPVVTPANLSTLDTVHVSATITNAGNAVANNFAWRLRLGTTTIASGNLSLGAGASHTITGLTINPLPTGTYTITLEADYTNVIVELSESNNVASTNFTVGTPVVAYVVVTPGSATINVGQSIQLTATAYTANNIPIPGPLAVVWSSSNSAVASVSAGQVTGVAAGTATITAIISGQSGTATINVVQSLPDLIVSSGAPTVTPTTVMAGKTVQLSPWTVTNAGNAPSGSFSNGFYLSTNSTISPGDTYLSGNSNLSLAPGESFNWGGPSLGIPANTPPGTYYIGIYVDRNLQVTEVSEQNNGVGTPITILPAAPTISGYNVTVVKLNDPTCSNTGTRFGHSFQYSDPTGTVSKTQSIINAYYYFQPSGVNGTFSIHPVSTTGTTSGTATFETCTRFNGDTMISFSITLTDDQGAESNTEYVDVQRPVGANGAELVDASRRMLPVGSSLKTSILKGGGNR